MVGLTRSDRDATGRSDSSLHEGRTHYGMYSTANDQRSLFYLLSYPNKHGDKSQEVPAIPLSECSSLQKQHNRNELNRVHALLICHRSGAQRTCWGLCAACARFLITLCICRSPCTLGTLFACSHTLTKMLVLVLLF